MKKRVTDVLLSVLTLAMLLGAALAVPLGSLTEEAQRAYLDEAPAVDDEYAFLFDD